MASPKLAAGDGSYDFHLRSLSAASRDSAAAADPASDPNLLQSVSARISLRSPSSSPDPCWSRIVTCVALRVEGADGVRDVQGGQGGQRRDGGAGVSRDEQALPALRRRAHALHGLHRRAAASKTSTDQIM